jgi:hypothetical protein
MKVQIQEFKEEHLIEAYTLLENFDCDEVEFYNWLDKKREYIEELIELGIDTAKEVYDVLVVAEFLFAFYYSK